MSIEFARPMKTVAAGVAAAAFLFAQQAVADNNGITRFAVRNCTDAKVVICTYNKDDSILAVPYDVNVIKPGKKNRASCGSPNQCKAFSLISNEDIKKVLTNPLILGTSAGGAGLFGAAAGPWTSLNLMGGTSLSFEAIAGIGVVAGVAIGVGGFIGSVKTVNAVEAAKTCERALKDARKAISDITDAKLRQAARASLRRTLSGSWPKYKNYSFVTQDGVPALVEGDKC